MRIDWIETDFDLPAGVRACRTLGGDGGDLGAEREADGSLASRVLSRREHLRGELGVERIAFLSQVHGVGVHEADLLPADATPVADAVTTCVPGVACAVLTADCLPVLFWNLRGDRVAAAHAGWRGLCAGVLESTLARFDGQPAEVCVWLGAAIGPGSFEVGPEVRAAFLARTATAAPAAELAACFTVGEGDRWYADLYRLARVRLTAAGVTTLYGGGEDCLLDAKRWFSHRRDGSRAGRQASLIWIEAGLSRSS
ncbi:MAG: laccase domain-containing protein [Gammaproteobacteria bacterium]|nr:laccase domain-containing protein [Gammaproteobacteria bacterium]